MRVTRSNTQQQLTFHKYTFASDETAHSIYYYLSLSFRDATALAASFPASLPPGSLQSFRFIIAPTLSVSNFDPIAAIPSNTDIAPITKDWESAYAEGARYIELTFEGVAMCIHFKTVGLNYD